MFHISIHVPDDFFDPVCSQQTPAIGASPAPSGFWVLELKISQEQQNSLSFEPAWRGLCHTEISFL